MNLETNDPLAISAVKTIHVGDVELLRRLLNENTSLARARLGTSDACNGMSRTLLHVTTDWPGHYPNGAATVTVLVTVGADVNAPFIGNHRETPLHWAASSDDVAVLDALLDCGADIEASGGVIANGTPLTNAVAFGQWKAAKRLVERGAQTPLSEAAALGLMEHTKEFFTRNPPPNSDQTNRAFWYACHGGSLPAAEFLYEQGASLNWLPAWENKTPLDVARRSKAAVMVDWLCSRGAKSDGERK